MRLRFIHALILVIVDFIFYNIWTSQNDVVTGRELVRVRHLAMHCLRCIVLVSEVRVCRRCCRRISSTSALCCSVHTSTISKRYALI